VQWEAEFVGHGMVAVEDALDRSFCEEVVARRLADLGVDETDRRTWPAGRHNMPAATVYPFDEVAPAALAALHELVGGADALAFAGLSDNLIVNYPDPTASWWPPEQWDAPAAGWHKDGDWFRHFLDSPEQGILGIVFWRDVTERQGPTYVAADSIGPVARFLAEHPEGIQPGGFPIREVLSGCRDLRPLTGRQGTVVWAHPFMVHTASTNATDRLRIISNTTAVLRQPLTFAGPGPRTPVEQVVLDALGVDRLDFRIRGERQRLESDRERRWKAEQAAHGSR
jgi:hypothetical protein